MLLIALIGIILGFILILLISRSQDEVLKERESGVGSEDIPLPFSDTKKDHFYSLCKSLVGNLGLELQEERHLTETMLELVAVNRTPILGGTYIFACLLRTIDQLVDTDQVMELSSMVKAERASKGVLITTGYFTADAHYILEGAPVELVNREQFAKLIEKFNLV